MIIKSIYIFSITTLAALSILHATDLTPQESNRVAIVVNKYLKQEIEDNLNIYLQDLRNEGYEPILKEWDLENDPTPRALKRYLKELYLEDKGLQGAVFIGDLPIPIVEIDPQIKDRFRSWFKITNYIAEKYYMDLIGKNWQKKDENYQFEGQEYTSDGEVFEKDYKLEVLLQMAPKALKQIVEEKNLGPIPEIWTSRIVTSALTGLFKKSEKELVNKYLENNHAYRTGLMVFQRQNLLYSVPKMLQKQEPFKGSKKTFEETKNIMSSFDYILKNPIPPPSEINEFFEPLKYESYEILYWARHGVQTSINLGYDHLTSKILANTSANAKTAFVFPDSCWIGSYIEPAYFAGSYIFNEQFFVLGMATSTLPVKSGPSTSTMLNLIEGKNLGLAFKQANTVPDDKVHSILSFLSNHDILWNARYVLGDGTLTLQSKFTPNNNQHQYDKDRAYYYIKASGNRPTEFDDANTLDLLLIKALENKDDEMLEILIEKGADTSEIIKVQDQEGNSPLHLAAAEEAAEKRDIGILIKLGFDVKTKNKLGKTPWDIAKENHNEITMFRATVQYGTPEQAKFLIKNGADINAKDWDWNTLLHKAIEENNIKIVQFLIENGADINVENSFDQTPWQIANDYGNQEIMEILEKAGANTTK